VSVGQEEGPRLGFAQMGGGTGYGSSMKIKSCVDRSNGQ
jgi:hypothetical protein